MSSIKDFESIKLKREFDKTYKRASKVWHTDSFVLFYLSNNSKKVAFVASKKVGKAVKRNRAKRLLRALFLEYIQLYKSGNYILVAKVNILNKNYSSLKSEWRRSLQKSRLLREN